MATNIRVLIVDDDTSILGVLKTLMQREGFDVATADSSDKGFNLLRNEEFDLLLSDIVMQPFDGLTLLQQARKINPDITVVMMTGFASIETAKKAMKFGAFDYITKPFKIDELKDTVGRAVKFLRHARGEDVADGAKKVTLIKRHLNEFVGESESMHAVYKQILSLANVKEPVLICGECGTGKSLVAKALHATGNRSGGPLLTFNCAVYPEPLMEHALFGYVQMPTDEEGNVIKGLPVVQKGIFERANGGILVLEEIGGLPLAFQDRLLQVLTTGTIRRAGADRDIQIDVRMIADTVEDLSAKVGRQAFRQELYDRFAVHRIALPHLRDRKEDIDLLIRYHLIQCNQQHNAKVEIEPGATKILERYRWPGNVRELISSIYRSARGCANGRIDVASLPVPVRTCAVRDKSNIFGYSDELDLRWHTLKKFIKTKEKEYVDQVLAATKGDVAQAAKLLGMDLAAFKKKYSLGGA